MTFALFTADPNGWDLALAVINMVQTVLLAWIAARQHRQRRK